MDPCVDYPAPRQSTVPARPVPAHAAAIHAPPRGSVPRAVASGLHRPPATFPKISPQKHGPRPKHLSRVQKPHAVPPHVQHPTPRSGAPATRSFPQPFAACFPAHGPVLFVHPKASSTPASRLRVPSHQHYPEPATPTHASAQSPPPGGAPAPVIAQAIPRSASALPALSRPSPRSCSGSGPLVLQNPDCSSGASFPPSHPRWGCEISSSCMRRARHA